MSDVLNMGGYAGYVWSCYGLSLLGLVALAWSSRRRLAQEQRNVQRRAQMGDTP